MRKAILYALILCLFVALATAYTVNTLSNSLTTETIANDTQVIRYIEIPRHANVSSAYIFITAVANSYVIESPTEYTNEGTPNCIGDGIDSLFDDDINTCVSNNPGNNCNNWINFTKSSYNLNSTELKLWLFDDDSVEFNNTPVINVSLNASFNCGVNDTHTRVRFRLNDDNITIFCINSTGATVQEIISYEADNVCEVSLNVTDYPREPSLTVGDSVSTAWSHSGLFTETNTQANITSDLNDVLFTCNCQNCTLTSNVCRVPLVFDWNDSLFSDYKYSETIASLEANYTYNTVELNNCSRGVPTINFTVLNLSDNTQRVTVDLEGNFNYSFYNSLDGTIVLNYSFSSTTNNETVCIYEEGLVVNSSAHLTYTFNSLVYTYFIERTELSNATKLIDLYVAEATSSVQFNVKDTNGNNIEDAYLTIERYDVGTNSYTTVEVLKTDNSGNAIGNLLLNLAWYRVSISYNEVTYLVDGPTLFTSSTKNYVINLLGDDWYDSYDDYKGISYSLIFNDTTNNFRLEYSDPNLVASNVCLKVGFSNNSVLSTQNDSCLATSPSGVILHNVVPINGTTYIGTAYAVINGLTFVLDTLEKSYATEWAFYDDENNYGVYVGFLITLSLMMLGIWHPITAVVLMLAGIWFARIIGFYYMSWPMFVGLALLGVIAMYKIGKAK